MKARYTLLLTPVFLLLLTPLWLPPVSHFLAPPGDFSSPADNKASDKTKMFALRNIIFSQQRLGQEEIRLTASQVLTDDADEQLQMAEVEALLNGGADHESIFVTSREAFYETKKEILTLIDDVNISGKNDFSLVANALRYLVKFKKIKSAEAVRLTTENIVVKGAGFFYDLRTGSFRVGGVGRVSCRIL